MKKICKLYLKYLHRWYTYSIKIVVDCGRLTEVVTPNILGRSISIIRHLSLISRWHMHIWPRTILNACASYLNITQVNEAITDKSLPH